MMANIQIDNCTDCPNCAVLSDPDYNDWFNDDDVKAFCTKAKKYITTKCRPYNLKKECNIPTWCPLNQHTTP